MARLAGCRGGDAGTGGAEEHWIPAAFSAPSWRSRTPLSRSPRGPLTFSLASNLPFHLNVFHRASVSCCQKSCGRNGGISCSFTCRNQTRVKLNRGYAKWPVWD